jgi:hypothetical protein
MSSNTIVISTLAACLHDQCGSCYGWLETDADKGLGVRCGCGCHLKGGWKFDRIMQAHGELDSVFRLSAGLGPELFEALRRVERHLTGEGGAT